MVKTYAAAAAALALVAGSAHAADLRRPEPIPAVAVAAPNLSWTGFYLGAHLGYAFGGRFDTNQALLGAVAPFRTSFGAPSGIFGGVQGGYDWQVNNVVVGLVGDLSYGDIRRRELLLGGPATVGASLGLHGSLRARAGILVAPDLLLYATGGLAMGQAKVTTAPVILSQSNTHFGWTAGFGGEYRFTPNISAFTEYRYTDLGRANYGNINPLLRAGYEGHSVRLGLNYRFNTGGGVVRAAY